MKSRFLLAGCGALLLSCSADDGFDKAPPSEPSSSVSVPISGGTLAVGLAQGRAVAVASDPERNLISVVDIADGRLLGQAQLGDGDEPGRVAISSSGVAYVALRRGGAVVTVALPSGQITERRAVCAAPRGVDVDEATGNVFVVCQTGELVRLPAQGEEGKQSTRLQLDLRDVVVKDGQLAMTTFRHAQLTYRPIDSQDVGPITPVFSGANMPSVAWRATRTPAGGLVWVHQAARSGGVSTGPNGYGSQGCDSSIVQAQVRVDQPDTFLELPLPGVVLPVDVAMAPSGDELVVVAAGSREDQGSVVHVRKTPDAGWVVPPCALERSHPGRMVSAAYSPDGRLVVQSREPAALHIGDVTVSLSQRSVHQPGSDLFHTDVGTGIACASCHPEGQEDGQTWNFFSPGGGSPQARRTIPLGGGLLDAQPFHWSADLPSMDALLTEVMAKRMGGKVPSREGQMHLGLWLHGLERPVPIATPDTDAVTRGRALFERADVGCATCHSGEKLSDYSVVDVGTGEPLKVPSLRGLAHRAPFLHNGCAATLHERFTSVSTNGVNGCGGLDRHGHTSHLASAEIDDLVTYLESL